MRRILLESADASVDQVAGRVSRVIELKNIELKSIELSTERLEAVPRMI